MDTQNKFVIVVANKTMFNDNFEPIQSAFARLVQVQNNAKKVLVISKVDNQSLLEKTKEIMTQLLPNIPTHHFLFCEQVQSIYSLVRQFDAIVDIVIDSFQESYDQTAKFLPGKYHLTSKPLDQIL